MSAGSLQGSGKLLKKRQDTAVVELENQLASFEAFSEHQGDQILEWKKAVERYEANPADAPNPYAHRKSGTLDLYA